jgi:hypothetical protein
MEDLQTGPGKTLSAAQTPLRVPVGETSALFVQVLDVNGQGVNDAHVAFTRTDATRLVWSDAAEDASAISVATRTGDAYGIVGIGIARAPFRVPLGAEPGEANVVAVLKEPADPAATVAVTLTVEVTASGGDGGTTAEGGSAGTAGASGQSGSGG